MHKTEHVYTDVLAFSSTWSTISIRVPFRRLVLLKGSFCSSCCYCFMFGVWLGELQIETVMSLPPAAPVPAYIDNVRYLKCMLRGSIPYCGVHDREGGEGSPFDSSWFIWNYAKNRTRQSVFQFLCGKPSKGSGAWMHHDGVE